LKFNIAQFWTDKINNLKLKLLAPSDLEHVTCTQVILNTTDVPFSQYPDPSQKWLQGLHRWAFVWTGISLAKWFSSITTSHNLLTPESPPIRLRVTSDPLSFSVGKQGRAWYIVSERKGPGM